MKDGEEVLREVSRSFYLTLRWLPRAMREAAGLAYLLARAGDTLADSGIATVEERMKALSDLASLVAVGGTLRVSESLMEAVPHAGERRLLGMLDQVLVAMEQLSASEKALVRDVLRTIYGGQMNDLERFGRASADCMVSLADDAAVEDYAWRVAGCVGEFWTKLGFLTCGSSFARLAEEEMVRMGIAYGKGLQLVNILRDMRTDLAAGRCYLPLEHPGDAEQWRVERQKWGGRARRWLGEGVCYAEQLGNWRLRATTVLPARIGVATLDLLAESGWQPVVGVKVPRRRVYGMATRALVWGVTGWKTCRRSERVADA